MFYLLVQTQGPLDASHCPSFPSILALLHCFVSPVHLQGTLSIREPQYPQWDLGSSSIPVFSDLLLDLQEPSSYLASIPRRFLILVLLPASSQCPPL